MASNPLGCSEAEWNARLELASCYRIFNKLGWTELIYNHISLRVPGPERHFLINSFGLHYSEVKASNLLKVDLEGNVLPPVQYASSCYLSVGAELHLRLGAASMPPALHRTPRCIRYGSRLHSP